MLVVVDIIVNNRNGSISLLYIVFMNMWGGLEIYFLWLESFFYIFDN